MGIKKLINHVTKISLKSLSHAPTKKSLLETTIIYALYNFSFYFAIFCDQIWDPKILFLNPKKVQIRYETVQPQPEFQKNTRKIRFGVPIITFLGETL